MAEQSAGKLPGAKVIDSIIHYGIDLMVVQAYVSLPSFLGDAPFQSLT